MAPVDDLSYPLACDDRTRDAVHTIVSGRKSWKTLKGKGEAVWPPYLEAALVEALDKYRPETSRSTRSLSRFPNRNRFISDYIFHVTGKRRTAKQVGSRLQQLRDTCGGKRILKLLSNREFPAASDSTPDELGAATLVSLSSPTALATASPTIKPTRALVHIDVLPANAPWPPSSSNSSSDFRTSGTSGSMLTPPLSPTSLPALPSLSPLTSSLSSSFSTALSPIAPPVNTFHSPFPRPLRVIDPTVTFTSSAHVRAESSCAVYFNGNCVYREVSSVSCEPANPENGAAAGYVYRSMLVPGFWQKLCESNDPGRYSIVQEIMHGGTTSLTSSPSSSSSSSSRLPSPDLKLPTGSNVLLTVVYQLNEPASSSQSIDYDYNEPLRSISASPTPSLEGEVNYGFPLSMLSSTCDPNTGYLPQSLPISPVSATFGENIQQHAASHAVYATTPFDTSYAPRGLGLSTQLVQSHNSQGQQYDASFDPMAWYGGGQGLGL